MKKWIIAGLLCAVVGGVAVAFTRTDSEDGDQGPKTVTVELGTLVDKALVTGEIAPRHEVDVKSKISGTVARIFVQEGERVNLGDPVLEVRPNPTPLEYAQKKRTLEMQVLVEKQRGTDLDRVKGLLDRGMVSRADFDAAKEAAERAVLRRKMAEEELAILDRGKAVVAGRIVESIIVSPVAGHVLQLHVDVGDPVVPLTSYQPGTGLITLADMDDLLLKGSVDEIDVGKIHEGMDVEIKVGAFPDQKVRGVLQRISLKSRKKDNATVFDAEIGDLVASSEVRLRAGYSANADGQSVTAPISLLN
ncbi:MAG: HlyD family efflux transporter periplasmic adaptor subunit [bacterium]|nr:HlyD family efflux transporter periplasmic adaptor subunit [bacterium]